MKKMLFLVGVAILIVMVSESASALIGGDQGWIEVKCNIDGASVSFDGQYKCTIAGGSCTVPVYTTGTPYTILTVDKTGYYPFQGHLTMPAAGETRTFYATLNPIPTTTPVPPPPEYGTIYVESSPSGAAIYLNGNYRGVSPLWMYQVLAGTYTIEADLSGYQPYTTSKTLYAGQQLTVYCPLVPYPSTGSLYVTSVPSNANVYLDSVYKGRTPLTLNSVATGTHIIEIDLSGYYDWKSTLNVPSGGTRTVTATLSPIPASNVGWIFITSNPGGATVYLDGSVAGQTASDGVLKINNVMKGDHNIRVELADYQPYVTTVNVQVNTVSDVMATLVPAKAPVSYGTLVISSTPPGASVFIDNGLRGVTPITLGDIPAGSHEVLIRLGGYNDYTSAQQVSGGSTNTIAVTLNQVLPPQTPKSGTLPVVTLLGALAVFGFIAFRQRK